MSTFDPKKDYYNILEVPYQATKSQIKKSYRKLAAKYHPDSNSDEANEEKFKQINEAYSILSDSDNKSKYDSEFFKSKNQNYTNRYRRDNQRTYSSWDIFFNNFDFGFNKKQNQSSDWTYINNIQNKDLTYTINESIKNLLLVDKREIHIKKYNVCKSCRGYGMNKCQKCKGSGLMKTSYGDMMCTECNGSGLNKVKCSKCEGKGYTTQEKNIKIKLNARQNNLNIKYSKELGYYAMVKASGLGNTIFNSNYANTLITGDLYVKILIDLPDNIKFDEDYNIVQHYPIKLSDLLFNEYNYIQNLEEREFKLKINSANYLSNITFTLNKEGILYNNKITNYIFKFNPYFPNIDNLTDEEYQTLNKILNKI